MSDNNNKTYPTHTGSGWWLLSSGKKVRGEKQAHKAQGLIDPEEPATTTTPAPEPEPDQAPTAKALAPAPSAKKGKKAKAATATGTVFVDCRTHPSGNGTGLADPQDLTTIVDHTFCPAP